MTSTTKTSSVQNVSPGVHNSTLTLNNGLIEVESVEIESMVETPSCEPNADDRNSCEEEVETSGVVEGNIGR